MGKIDGKFVALTPNQVAKVAAYAQFKVGFEPSFVFAENCCVVKPGSVAVSGGNLASRCQE